MVIPELMPEELAFGYLQRLQAINGHHKPTDTISALRKRYKPNRTGYCLPYTPVMHLLAEAMEMPLAEFCQKHTLVPFTRAISKQRYQNEHGTPATIAFVNNGMTLEHNGFYCPHCMENDVRQLGFTYLRRIHQLPTIYYCPQHKAKLVTLIDRKGLQEHYSDHKIQSAVSVGADISSNKFVRRYIDIITNWMSRTHPVRLESVGPTIRERAEFLGLRPFDGLIFLSDVALELFPKRWLTTAFPAFRTKAPGIALSNTDYAYDYRSATVPITSLHLALLFSSVDDAMRALNRNRDALHSPNEEVHQCGIRLLSNATHCQPYTFSDHEFDYEIVA